MLLATYPSAHNPDARGLLEEPSEDLDPSEVIAWAAEALGPRGLVVSTSFQPSGLVNLHLLASVAPQVPVVFIDTLYHFDETLDLAETIRRRYGLDLRVVRPARSRVEFERRYGSRLWERDLELFHELTRVQPMRQALRGVSGWITGRRRDQSPSRAAIPQVEVGRYIKVNPLAAWTSTQVWDFIRAHGIPYNPLHDQGYTSIGDAPLTTPTLMGEDERAGRWRGQSRLECGLHTRI